MTVLTRTRWGRTAGIVGLVALGLMVAVFFIPGEAAKDVVYGAAFLGALAALAFAATARLQARHEKVALKPQTRLGWWSVWLALAGLVLAVALPTLLSTAAAGLEGPLVAVLNVVVLGFAAAIAAGVTAMVAWFRRAERSLLVLLTALPAMFALYFLIGELVFPH